MVYIVYIWYIYGVYMVYIWCIHSVHIVYIWCIYGINDDYPHPPEVDMRLVLASDSGCRHTTRTLHASGVWCIVYSV